MKRYRVLQLAESANPEWTSGPLIGWSYSRSLAEITDAHLVTQVRNRDALLRAGLSESTDFTSIDSEAIEARLYKLGSKLRGGEGRGWTTMKLFAALGYYEFERLAWNAFSKRLAAGEFDLVHRITPISPTTPSLFAKRCARLGVPFVVGPLNGGVPWPKAFDTARRAENEWLSYVRGMHRLLPAFGDTRRFASAIIAGSLHTWDELVAESEEAKCFYLPENGIDPNRFQTQRTHQAKRPVRVLFVGRLVPYKGADMLIEAATPALRAGDLEIDIVGDGPEREKLEGQIRKSNLSHCVHLHGQVPHGEVGDWMRRADLLALPSIREFGGGVVLEAMAVGLPSLVVRYAGPAELVTPNTGFLVELAPRSELISSLRTELEMIAAHPELVDRRSNAAQRRVEHAFTWEKKATQMHAIYRWVLEGGERPDLGRPIPDLPEA